VRSFLPIAAGTFAIETAVVLMFLMPIVTSVVHYHRRRDPIVSFATRQRVRMRTAAAPKPAQASQTAALRAAWQALPKVRRCRHP
jgi:hypothetical protein